MDVTGNLRKMRAELIDGKAHYALRLFDVITPGVEVDLNALIGKSLKLEWLSTIHCVVTGKTIAKTFGEGMSYDAFRSSPMAVESIVRPELSRIHEGIALRDAEWEEAHHNQPHYVYLSQTSGLKVGVTRTVNVPTRWIDQGAVAAVVIAETPYRQLAGLIEVALKAHYADRTQWRAMLSDVRASLDQLADEREAAFSALGEPYEPFFVENAPPLTIAYPVKAYPEKVKSVKLDKQPVIEGELVGIKGQYLLFADGSVFNVRSHAGYQVRVSGNA